MGGDYKRAAKKLPIQMDGQFWSLQVLRKHAFKFIFRNIANKFLQDISIGIQKIKLRLIIKSKRTLERICVGIVGIKIGEFDFAKILRFKPMNHGRHCAAGTSGEAEKFHQLQPA